MVFGFKKSKSKDKAKRSNSGTAQRIPTQEELQAQYEKQQAEKRRLQQQQQQQQPQAQPPYQDLRSSTATVPRSNATNGAPRASNRTSTNSGPGQSRGTQKSQPPQLKSALKNSGPAPAGAAAGTGPSPMKPKSALKSQSKYNTPSTTGTSTSPTYAAQSRPSANNNSSKYGSGASVDVDDLESMADMSVFTSATKPSLAPPPKPAATTSKSSRPNLTSNTDNNHSANSIDVDDLPFLRKPSGSSATTKPTTNATQPRRAPSPTGLPDAAAGPPGVISTRPSRPKSSIRGAVKKTEAHVPGLYQAAPQDPKIPPAVITSVSTNEKVQNKQHKNAPKKNYTPPPAVITPTGKDATNNPSATATTPPPANKTNSSVPTATTPTTKASTPTPTKSPNYTRTSNAGAAVPKQVLKRSSSNVSAAKSVLTYGSGYPNTRDDMSIVSMDMSVVSKVSVHMDHFLAEMALADNARLEQLAVEEMKHRQIIPQKIKKLNKKIAVLYEEREVLVGLIDQLQELVDNQEQAKRKRREKRKEKKKAKKAAKKAKKKKAKAEQKAKKAAAAAEAKASGDPQNTNTNANANEETDSDEEYLAEKRARGMSGGESVRGTWWKDDASVNPNAKNMSMDGSLSGADPILGGDDDFAMLWDNSVCDDSTIGSTRLEIPMLDPDQSVDKITGAAALESTSNTAAKVAAGVGAAAIGTGAVVAGVASARNKKKKDDDKETEEEEGEPSKKSTTKNDDDLPDLKEIPKEKDELQEPPKFQRKGTTESFTLADLDDDFVADEEQAAAAKDKNNHIDQHRQEGDDSFDDQDGLGVLDDDSVTGGIGKSDRKTNRFSIFQETDTYLPGHMPGSAGNSPEGSVKGDKQGSDSDSVSDSDSEDSGGSKSSVSSAATQMILEEEEEEPSSSHHLAKQLMARLKQQEKQQEQEELQRNLQGIIRRNSNRKLNIDDGSYDGDGGDREGIDHSYMNNFPAATRRISMPSDLNAGDGGVPPSTITAEGPYAVVSPFKEGASSAEMAELQKQLEITTEEMEKLRQERAFQEARVKELLAALETKFDDDIDEEEDEELEEADDINESSTIGDSPRKNVDAPDTKKRKRMQGFLAQKVDECATLSATVEQLKEELAQKQEQIEELELAQDIPMPAAGLVSAVSADLSSGTLQKQLLEKTAECFDLQDQIRKLEEQLQEKDQQYQEVHRDLFTANLALGVEVDRKAQAQEKLNEKCEEFEAVEKENEDLKNQMSKMEERIEALDDELLSRATMLDEMKSKHDEGLNVVARELEAAKTKLTGQTTELETLRQKASNWEREKEMIIQQGAANDEMVGELRKLLSVETDKKEQLELQITSIEADKASLKEELERARKENEINKALLQDNKKDQDGESSANIQAEVEKLISENADLKKSLTNVQESEASMKKERERLVANATNMSIMLADSRAKVDFLQMQLEEFKSGPLSNSQHGGMSQSEHGFSQKRAAGGGFRNLIPGASASAHGTSSGGGMGDHSERSVGSMGMGGSQRGTRNTRFRNFLQNRMGGGDASTSS